MSGAISPRRMRAGTAAAAITTSRSGVPDPSPAGHGGVRRNRCRKSPQTTSEQGMNPVQEVQKLDRPLHMRSGSRDAPGRPRELKAGREARRRIPADRPDPFAAGQQADDDMTAHVAPCAEDKGHHDRDPIGSSITRTGSGACGRHPSAQEACRSTRN